MESADPQGGSVPATGGARLRGGGAARQLLLQNPPALPALPYALATAPYPLYQHPASLYGLPPSLPLQPFQYSQYSPAPPIMYPWHPSLLPPSTFPGPPLPLSPYPHYTAIQQPVHITSVQEQNLRDREKESLPWLQRLAQSDRDLCEGVMGDVCGEVVESALPDLVREMVNATFNDIIFSYIGHQWAAGTRTPRRKPRPPSQPQPIRLPSAPLEALLVRPHSHPPGGKERREVSGQAEAVLGEEGAAGCGEGQCGAGGSLAIPVDCQDRILHCRNKTELCREVSALLLEQLLFAQLLTSDLDGGVTMATRTQSIHFLNAMVFDELLIKLITSDHTH